MTDRRYQYGLPVCQRSAGSGRFPGRGGSPKYMDWIYLPLTREASAGCFTGKVLFLCKQVRDCV